MARYRHVDLSPRPLPVDLESQLVPGTFAHAVHHLVDDLDLSAFDSHYRNDDNGAPAHSPAMLLKVVLLAYSQGLVSSRRIERACRDNVLFIAISGDAKPHFTTVADIISRSRDAISSVFGQVLSVLSGEAIPASASIATEKHIVFRIFISEPQDVLLADRCLLTPNTRVKPPRQRSAWTSKKRLPTSFGIKDPEEPACHDGVSTQPSAEGEVSVSTITIGVDLAKNMFSVCLANSSGRVLDRKDLRRDAFVAYLVQLPAETVVAMEACSGAHYWGRRCVELGLQPLLMAAQFVKPFRKSARNKNDRNDAEAIATAARQGNMRFVPLKSIDQQVRLSWHRAREGYKTEGLAIGNRIRGLLAEFGVVISPSDAALRLWLADLDSVSLPSELVELIRDLAEHWDAVRERVVTCDRRIDAHARTDERCVRVRSIIGIGSLTADALVATIGDAKEFKNGRQLSAWLGLVPTQHSSGGHTRLGGISCRGDAYLRTLLIQGARSSLQRAKAVSVDKATPEQLWIRSLVARLPFGKLIVAIASKHARQLWVMLAREVDYDAHAQYRHPLHCTEATA